MSVTLFLLHRWVHLCLILDSTHKWYHVVFVFVDLTSLNMIISSYIHVAANGIALFFWWLSSIPLSTCTTSSLSGHLSVAFRLFPGLGCSEQCCREHGVHVSFWIRVLSGYMPRVGLLDHVVTDIHVESVYPYLLTSLTHSFIHPYNVHIYS